ncbi:ABC transporter ATP-binding protein [Halanaerobium saccharolyticum]|jgi:oligopeptide/dipeptide ABC transporter ATP-binding protein|uniref:Peptide/nickel transport system ATP-binding protein/oligopeptide transport system ATP-binding protein n=1 Tax=Halanaerobium saccharolyticum TaxID=43595 RepID=A0A4R6RDS0_9FIRM|nr:oligopeptide/dipeptide ABC transporter ATP-binding protein [Halanaerobium saccharolyticum]TDP84421.1 peptide/nickel transport system ATP-binding protein/oligopeptide transport system ATP-binding protein [Halanaerobium saccharolyticum]
MQQDTLVEIDNLKQYFAIEKGIFNRKVGEIKAVNGVNLKIKKRETLGLVGESGCGKSTLGRAVLRLQEPTAGDVYFNQDDEKVSVLELNNKEMRKVRANMQMIFQDPFSSLNERMTVMDNIIEPLVVNNIGDKASRKKRAGDLLEEVGLRREYLSRYPHSFSGGQRQRVGIARALSIKPQFIVADEPVSALDVSVQAQILNLLKKLQKELDLTFLFISHDLGVIRYVSDRIAVMYMGNIVEIGEREELLRNPHHPYTEALLSAVPRAGQRRNRIVLEGSTPDPINLPSGCIFRTRCPYAEEKCKEQKPEWENIEGEHFAACHFKDSLELKGIKNRKRA